MSYMRKILLFVISAAMVVVGLLLLAFGLLAAMPRGGRLRSSDCICCGRISLRRCSHVADLAVATDVTTGRPKRSASPPLLAPKAEPEPPMS
jgi:hypothetical protein